jgi:hypothetical protein
LSTTAQELSLLAGLYSIWRLARLLPLATTGGASDRARQIDRLQHWLHLPTELSLQHLVLRHESLGRFLNYYYAIAHVPALIAFLVWMFAFHRSAYSRWRNALAMVTGMCLVIRFVRVAPPRLLPDLGYVDLSSRFGMSVYGPVGTGVSDQFAQCPRSTSLGLRCRSASWLPAPAAGGGCSSSTSSDVTRRLGDRPPLVARRHRGRHAARPRAADRHLRRFAAGRRAPPLGEPNAASRPRQERSSSASAVRGN